MFLSFYRLFRNRFFYGNSSFNNFFFNMVKLLTSNMQGFISKIVLFNNTDNRGLIISNFERSSINFFLSWQVITIVSRGGWVDRIVDLSFALTKFDFLLHSNVALKFHHLKHNSFQENQKTKYVFSIDSFFLTIYS